VTVTVTVAPGERPEIVKENKPSGNANPAGGAVGTLDSAEAVTLVNPPTVVGLIVNVTVPAPVAEVIVTTVDVDVVVVVVIMT
jgi:hypothetical protein